MVSNLEINIHRGFSYTNSVTIQDELGNLADLSAYEIHLDFYSTSGELILSLSESSGHLVNTTAGTILIAIPKSDTDLITQGRFVLYGVAGTNEYLFASGYVNVYPEISSNIAYLIPYLRVKIGDTSGERYLDEWLNTALILAIKLSQRYLGDKYIVNPDNSIIRNPNFTGVFTQSTGIIEAKDEPIIVILAAIIVIEGSLENSAWDAVSWKDNEISFSNLEQYRTRNELLNKLIDELNSLVLAPVKRLGKARVESMWGYSEPERKTKY